MRLSYEIKQYIDNSCGNIIADPTQIHQVIMNLCTNAVHAMDEKGTLTITLQETILDKTDLAHRPDMAAGRYVRLSVSDTGTGIAPDIVDHIFDPFFTTKETSQGTGMGLSVVHGIVMSHHGMVTVDSEPGKGSTFHVCFAVTGGENGRLARNAEALPTGTERILIVDDEESIMVTLVMILERLGYKTTAKTNGKDALETFKADPAAFDLVITDQTMPQLSGMELTIELLKIKPGLPIILCTGYSKKISDETARELGIRKFLLKPLDRTKLAQAVRYVLDSDKEPSPGN